MNVNTSGIATNLTQGTDAVTAEGWTAIGTFTTENISTKAYYIAQDKFWLSNSNLTVNPFRMYFNPPASLDVKSLGIFIGEFTPTAINSIEAELNSSLDGSHNILSLDGRIIRHNATSTE